MAEYKQEISDMREQIAELRARNKELGAELQAAAAPKPPPFADNGSGGKAALAPIDGAKSRVAPPHSPPP